MAARVQLQQQCFTSGLLQGNSGIKCKKIAVEIMMALKFLYDLFSQPIATLLHLAAHFVCVAFVNFFYFLFCCVFAYSLCHFKCVFMTCWCHPMVGRFVSGVSFGILYILFYELLKKILWKNLFKLGACV